MATNRLVTQNNGPPNIERGAVVNSISPITRDKISGVRRFSLADLESMGVTLQNRLRERYPHLTDKMFVGWIRGAMESNEHVFVRTEHAVGLASLIRDNLAIQNKVREVFVFCDEENTTEGKQIYSQIKAWATHLGATEVTVGTFSDVPVKMIEEVFGKLRSRVESVATV